LVVYSIKDLEQLCGIKAHTLRIWEKRYNILVPKRTPTNIRYYTEEDLKHALNVSILYRNGLKISKLAQLNVDEVRNRVLELTEIDTSFEKSLDTLSLSMFELDEYKFIRILDKHIEQNGFDDTMETVLYPLLEKISMMWMAGSLNEIHETFVLNIIKQKLIVELDELPIINRTKGNSFIIYIPETETQKLSLYYMYYTLRKRGFPVFLLGEDVNYVKLKSAHELLKPEYVFTIINDAFSDKPLQPYIDKLCTELDSTLIVSGYQAISQEVQAPENCKILPSLDEIMVFVNSIRKLNFITNK